MTWAPKPAAVGVAWGLAALATFTAVLLDDVRGAILLGIAALTLGLAALFGTVARPRLAADNTGVTVRGLGSTRRWTWAEVNVRVTHTRRFGRESVALEIDAENAENPDLVVLGMLDLGVDPRDVADALVKLRT
ncbi:PH domain-containing protein [Actinokineospora sp. HUAS TT18]|uniref:PH domain-containing protein n=1 Tax=Actinokineospora sp. HUAS TT18 TaxID=3447451 RepID=UPI003F51C1CE